MDMNLALYVEINGVKCQIDPLCCSLDFTVSTNKGGESRGCLKVTTMDGKSVYLDIV